MIRTFADRTTEAFFTHGICPAQWWSFAKVARRKLDMLNAAVRLQNLRSPPGNRLEALKGDRQRPMEHSYQRSVACLLQVDG